MTDLRALPPTLTATCEGCGRTVLWGVTVAGPNGPGGKRIALDPTEDLAGSYAVTAPHLGRLVARCLTKDEQVDRPTEYAAMPHVASCPTRTRPTFPGAAVSLRDQHSGRQPRTGDPR